VHRAACRARTRVCVRKIALHTVESLCKRARGCRKGCRRRGMDERRWQPRWRSKALERERFYRRNQGQCAKGKATLSYYVMPCHFDKFMTAGVPQCPLLYPYPFPSLSPSFPPVKIHFILLLDNIFSLKHYFRDRSLVSRAITRVSIDCYKFYE